MPIVTDSLFDGFVAIVEREALNFRNREEVRI